MAEFCSEMPRKLWKRCWPENIHIVGRQTYEGLKISINWIIETTHFFFDIRLSMYWRNAFVKILSKTCWVGKYLQDRGKIIQVWLTFNITMLLQTKKFKPVTNGNVADSGLIALIDEPLPSKTYKEWKFKCEFWAKKFNCCFSQIKTKHKWKAYLMCLCYFFSYL